MAGHTFTLALVHSNTIFTVYFNLKLFVQMERNRRKVVDVKTQIYLDFVANFPFRISNYLLAMVQLQLDFSPAAPASRISVT